MNTREKMYAWWFAGIAIIIMGWLVYVVFIL